jgi:hypothetical protein
MAYGVVVQVHVPIGVYEAHSEVDRVAGTTLGASTQESYEFQLV